MKGGATFINEGLADFTGSVGKLTGLTGTGIAEYWTNVPLSYKAKL